MKMRKIKYIVPFLIALLASACSDNTVFQQTKEMPNGIWEKDSVVNFYYDSKDTTEHYNIVIDLRNTDNYPFQNFWLFVNMNAPGGKQFRDTLQCEVAEIDGRWKGEGKGSVHHLPIMFQQNTKFAKLGKYHMQLIQGMRKDSLQGISDIGLRICKVEAGK